MNDYHPAVALAVTTWLHAGFQLVVSLVVCARWRRQGPRPGCSPVGDHRLTPPCFSARCSGKARHDAEVLSTPDRSGWTKGKRMAQRNTMVRSLHDIGLGAWFGGSLMGAVGLNGAVAQARDPRERLSLSATGWARWAPVNTVAVAAHVVGGLGLIVGNKGRLSNQQEARSNAITKAVLTGVAMGVTAYSGVLGRKVDRLSAEGGRGATEPSPDASPELASAQQQLRACQWATPALTGVLLVLGAQAGEQQRPLAGLLGR